MGCWLVVTRERGINERIQEGKQKEKRRGKSSVREMIGSDYKER
jgi:hypothetical protein